MLKSKGIRILCYIEMGVVYVLSVILVILGIADIADEKVFLGVIFLIAGLVMPLTVSVSLYPVFALSLIESNTSSLNDKLGDIIELLEKTNTLYIPPVVEQSTISTNKKTEPIETVESSVLSPTYAQEAIDFINKKYNIRIRLSDDMSSIKEKVSTIDDEIEYARIFKKRVNEAESLSEIMSSIKLLKYLYD